MSSNDLQYEYKNIIFLKVFLNELFQKIKWLTLFYEIYTNFCFFKILSLKITNAFNSLRWRRICKTMRQRQLLEYVHSTVKGYLHQRKLTYVYWVGELRVRKVTCSVSQESFLGPLLWNMAYYIVLRTRLRRGLTSLLMRTTPFYGIGSMKDTLG